MKGCPMPKMNNQQLYECSECALHYEDKKVAEKCAAWCSKYKSCNLEITKLSEEIKAVSTPKDSD